MFSFKILSPKFPKVADLGKEGLQTALQKHRFYLQGVCINPPVSQQIIKVLIIENNSHMTA